jgi:fructose-bisphosphate aldolase class II
MFTEMLLQAAQGGYGVGAFSPRYTKMILPVLEAAEELRSPVIVQISEKELSRHGVNLAAFAGEFYRRAASVTVPAALHLDHTKTQALIHQAIREKFMSVMIDASEYPFAENLRVSKAVADYAHARDVAVEAELGRIGATDLVETDTLEEFLTDPAQAETFARETGVDALAVSVGTAHGFYRQAPNIRYGLLRALNRRVGVPLVLHGGSDVPAEKIAQAVTLETGGVAKVNIATDLEQAMLDALGAAGPLTDGGLAGLSPEKLAQARQAVTETVRRKLRDYLLSAGKAGPCIR